MTCSMVCPGWNVAAIGLPSRLMPAARLPATLSRMDPAAPASSGSIGCAVPLLGESFSDATSAFGAAALRTAMGAGAYAAGGGDAPPGTGWGWGVEVAQAVSNAVATTRAELQMR